MNHALYVASLLSFLAVPPCLLAARSLVGRRIPWWGLLISMALLGWLFLNASVHFKFEYLCEPFGSDTWSIPVELEEQFQRCIGDGGQKAFALVFGWLPALIYGVLAIGAYALAARARAWRHRSGHAA